MHADGNAVGVVADPDGHVFVVLEHAAFDQHGAELDAAESAHLGLDFLFTDVFDVHRKNGVVEVTVDGEYIAFFGVAEIDGAGVVERGHEVLGVLGDGDGGLLALRRVAEMVETDVLVDDVTAFVHAADEQPGQHGVLIDDGFVAVADFEEPVEGADGAAGADDVVAVAVTEVLEFGFDFEGGFAGVDESVVNTEFEDFPGTEGVVVQGAEFLLAGGAGDGASGEEEDQESDAKIHGALTWQRLFQGVKCWFTALFFSKDRVWNKTIEWINGGLTISIVATAR